MKKVYLNILSKILYTIAIITPLVVLLVVYSMYQYKDLGFMIVLQSPDKTITPLFEPWVFFAAFAGIWIKAIFIWSLAGFKQEE